MPIQREMNVEKDLDRQRHNPKDMQENVHGLA